MISERRCIVLSNTHLYSDPTSNDVKLWQACGYLQDLERLLYQQNLKEKTRQMKAMASELNMYQAQVNEYKYEIERLTRELQDVKRKFYEQKRRDQLQQESNGADDQWVGNSKDQQTQQQTAAQAASSRFTGGGFNLQQ